MNDNQTEDYLAPYETSARLYCKKTGVDPDETVLTPNPIIPGMFREVPKWRFIAEELLDLSLKLTCMREASQQAKHTPAVN